MRIGDVIILVVYLGLIVVPSVICWLKGKRLWATLGCLSGWHLIPMIRLAKPNSWWADRYYDEHKMLLSKARFGQVPIEHVRLDATSLDEFTADDILFQDKITRKAWEKAQKRKKSASAAQ